MEKPSSRQWIEDLADGVSDLLNIAFPEDQEHPERAAIFIAVRQAPGRDIKEVSYDIRGKGRPLAEAIGALVYDRSLPPEIVMAAVKAITRRIQEDDKELTPILKELTTKKTD